MDKEEAINWCKELKNVPAWPQSPRFSNVPEGWRWVIRHLPYQIPEILLESVENVKGKRLEITKEDVK